MDNCTEYKHHFMGTGRGHTHRQYQGRQALEYQGARSTNNALRYLESRWWQTSVLTVQKSKNVSITEALLTGLHASPNPEPGYAT